jgi:hypothetical protein
MVVVSGEKRHSFPHPLSSFCSGLTTYVFLTAAFYFVAQLGRLLQVAVFSRTWPAARRPGQYMPDKAGIDGYFISVGERQPAKQVCIAKNSFPVSRPSLRTFLRQLI